MLTLTFKSLLTQNPGLMKKRMFFGLSVFALLFTLVAWQYASAELVELQKKPKPVEKEYSRAA